MAVGNDGDHAGKTDGPCGPLPSAVSPTPQVRGPRPIGRRMASPGAVSFPFHILYLCYCVPPSRAACHRTLCPVTRTAVLWVCRVRMLKLHLWPHAPHQAIQKLQKGDNHAGKPTMTSIAEEHPAAPCVPFTSAAASHRTSLAAVTGAPLPRFVSYTRQWLLCWRRAWLLFWLVLRVLTPGLPI